MVRRHQDYPRIGTKNPTVSTIKTWTAPDADMIIIQQITCLYTTIKTRAGLWKQPVSCLDWLQDRRQWYLFIIVRENCASHLWGNSGGFCQTSSNIFWSTAKWFVHINLTRFPFSSSLIGSDSHIPCLYYTEISNLILAPVKRLLDFQPSFFKARSNQDFSLRTPDLRSHWSPSPWPKWQEGLDFVLKGMTQ